VDQCINLLKNLEQRWSGAGRSRIIVEQLLASYRRHYESEGIGLSIDSLSASNAKSSGNKRKVDDANLGKDSFGSNDNTNHNTSDNDNILWQHAPGLDLMGVDLSDLMTFDIL
jgi:hypothetical protein